MRDHLKQASVNRAIQRFYHYLSNCIASKDVDGKRYSGLVLDLSNPRSSGKMGIGATSLGLSIYGFVSDESDRYTREMEEYVLSQKQPNGSWTISALIKHHVSLVYTTCYALEGLAMSDYSRNLEYLEQGISWLAIAVNGDGGFGFVENSQSHVHPTSEVLYFISMFQGFVNQGLFIRAKEWLLQQRVDDTYWTDDNQQPSLFHTALAYRGIISNGDFQNELGKTREWLEKELPEAPCREDISYFIPIGDQHIIEPITCYTRASIFLALTSSKYVDHNPCIEREAKRLLNEQSTLGFWQCDNSSKQIPTFLNYYVCIGLANYASYLDRRPQKALLADARVFFKLHPFLSLIIAVFFLIGVIHSFTRSGALFNWLNAQISYVNTYFEDLSGIANFFQITGISLLAGIALIYRFLIKRKKE